LLCCSPPWPGRAFRRARLAEPAGAFPHSARPGAGVDITARLFADKLSQRWGQPVVVENRRAATPWSPSRHGRRA